MVPQTSLSKKAKLATTGQNKSDNVVLFDLNDYFGQILLVFGKKYSTNFCCRGQEKKPSVLFRGGGRGGC